MDELKPCPFCGGPAKFSVCPTTLTLESGKKIENPNAGGEYIECVSNRCGVETMAIFPHAMVDAKPLLADIWNTRALQSQPTAERADLVKRLRILSEPSAGQIYDEGTMNLLREAADALENAAVEQKRQTVDPRPSQSADTGSIAAPLTRKDA